MLISPQSLLSKSALPYSSSKPRCNQRFLCLPSVSDHIPAVNINPFTLDTVRRNSEHCKRKSCRSDGDEEEDVHRYHILLLRCNNSI